MAKNVLNLDLLRPAERVVVVAGKEVDLSFIPCGVVFDVNDAVAELTEIVKGSGQDKILEGGKETGKAFSIMIRLCAIMTSVQHEELDEKFLRRNLSSRQVEALAGEIKDLLERELAQIPGNGQKKQRRPGGVGPRAPVRGDGDSLPMGDEGVPVAEDVPAAGDLLPQHGDRDEVPPG